MTRNRYSYRSLMRSIEQTMQRKIDAAIMHNIVSAALHNVILFFAENDNRKAHTAATRLRRKWGDEPAGSSALEKIIKDGARAIEAALPPREKHRVQKAPPRDMQLSKKQKYHDAHRHALAAYAAITQRGDMAIMQDVAMRLVRATELLVNDFAAAKKQLSALLYTQDADQRRIIGCLAECTRRWRMVVKIAASPDRNKISDEDVRYIEQQIYDSSIDPSEEACLLADALAAARAVFFDHTRASNEKNNLGGA